MIDLLLLPFNYDFFNRGLLMSILVGGICGLIGVYIVVRGLSYMGHGLSHSIFGGAMMSLSSGFNYYVGGIVWGIFSSILINEISRKKKIKPDAAIGLVTTASFALGIILISNSTNYFRNIESFLFGNILAISNEDLFVLSVVSCISLIFFFVYYKRLLFTFFDSESAKIFGVNVRLTEILFTIILSLVIISSMTSIGVTLLAAVLIGPALTARLLTNQFNRLVVLSSIIGICCCFSGMYLSFYLDYPSGPTIVILIAFAFLLSQLVSYVNKLNHIHSHGAHKHSHPHTHTNDHRHEHK